jgi:hypothetical protein
MAISYNAIVGHKAKMTLPSVESWGTNNNILRDPPKSIMTRRIDKVNEDGSLNEMFYHSGDRFAESINVFARGVNPMVSVQYGNVNGGANAKLPYRIMNGGAFRPPELRQEQLLPLSRQPRLPTHVESRKEFIDYTKSALCDSQPKVYRQVVKDKIEGFIPPTKTMKIDKPVKEHFEVSYVLDNPLRGDYYSNMSYRKQQYADDINIELERNLPEYSSHTNMSENIAMYIAPDKEIILEQNMPHYLLQTQKSKNMAGNGVLNDEIHLENNMPHYLLQTQKSDNSNFARVNHEVGHEFENNIPHYLLQTQKSDGKNFVRVNHEVGHEFENNIPHYLLQTQKSDGKNFVRVNHEVGYEFENNMPLTTAQTNKTENIQIDAPTRSFNRLAPSLHPGEFKGVPTLPQTQRNIQYNQNYSTSKTEIAQKMMRERK